MPQNDDEIICINVQMINQNVLGHNHTLHVFFKGARKLHKPSNVDQRLAPLLFGKNCLRATNIDFGVECEYEALGPSNPIMSRL